MKICFLVSSLSAGGSERVAATLCNVWAARGDMVTLIPTYSGGGKPFYQIDQSVELIYLSDVVDARRKNPWTYMRRMAALRRLVARREPDVIVSFLPNVNIAAILSTAFLRIPVIICERTDPVSFVYPMPLRLLCRLTYRFADMLTVQTESVADKVVKLYPGLRSVRAVPNPLPKGVSAFQRQGKNRRKILLSLGRLSPEKQTDRLIAAFAEIAEDFTGWDLHLYGDGPQRLALEEQIRRHGLQQRVLLKGTTASPWRVMAGADAFVMVSRSEGFPNALLEAMAVGLPCVVFDCPSGPREITRDGRDALLVPLNDQRALVTALTRIFGDEALMRRLATQARESVQSRYALSEVIAQWDRLFDEVGEV